MKDYGVFGGRLRSAVEFDKLPRLTSEGRPTWRLEMAPSPPAAGGPVLGRDGVQDGVEVRLSRENDGFRLTYDDTGVFQVSGDGGRIRWSPGTTADPGDVRLDILGRVLPLALHLQGFLVLHASAIVDRGTAVGFVGPKRSGKSTVALALHREGASVLTDDVLVLDVRDDGVTARPGIPHLRLRRDTASSAGLRGTTDSDDGPFESRGRTLLRTGSGHSVRPVPLRALYLLDPPPPEVPAESMAVRFLPGARAAAALVGQAKLGPLLAGWDAAGLLERASSVVKGVLVRALQLPRGLEGLGEAAAAVLEADRQSAIEGDRGIR